MSNSDPLFQTLQHVPVFKGEKEEFQVWWMRFKGHAARGRFIMALSPTKEADLPLTEASVIDETTPSGKLQAAAKQRNADAMGSLIIACQHPTMISYIYESQTTDWPGGLAHVVIARLLAAYQPTHRDAEVEIRRALNALKMEATEPPDVLFAQISAIKNWFNSGGMIKVNDETLIMMVHEVAPPEYSPVLSSLEIAKGNVMTLDDIQVAMH